jgi:hypothetical protein
MAWKNWCLALAASIAIVFLFSIAAQFWPGMAPWKMFYWSRFNSATSGSVGTTPTTLGQFGDFIGGIVGTVLSALTLLAVGLTYYSQRQQLQSQREELSMAKHTIRLEKLEQMQRLVDDIKHSCKSVLSQVRNRSTGNRVVDAPEYPSGHFREWRILYQFYFPKEDQLGSVDECYVDFITKAKHCWWLANKQQGSSYASLPSGEKSANDYFKDEVSNAHKALDAACTLHSERGASICERYLGL